MPTVRVTRYLTPLREGGSLPGLVEAEDLGIYVCKFTGAGQGPRALVAEVVVAGLATALGLRTPRQVVLELDAEIARYEADQEVQDLLTASAGANLGIDFLPGAFGFDPQTVDPGEATRVLWLDAFSANVDRTWRNPNLLVWHDRLWVIDHGAALYFHHGWTREVGDPERFAAQPWDPAGHVFAEYADRLDEVDRHARATLSDPGRLADIVGQVPDVWLQPVAGAGGPEGLRAAYVRFLLARLGSRRWLPVPAGAGGRA